jgi:hypothetical protein
MKYFLLLIFLAGCTTPNVSTSDLSKVKKDQILILGKITINKKFPESTNVLDVMDVTKSALIRASSAPLPFHEVKPSSFEKGDILVKWGENFSVPFERFPEVYVQGIYAFTYDKTGQTTFTFPITGFFNVPTGARSIYVGTIALEVDDFFLLKSVRVIDEFEGSKKVFGKYPALKKSLFQINRN